jgi:hypothetical protein
MKRQKMSPTCHCQQCGCLISGSVDKYGTAQVKWSSCPHLSHFERGDGVLYAIFKKENDDARTKETN